MSTIKLKRIKQVVDTGVTQPLSIGGVASDNSDEVMNIASNGDLQFKKIIQTNGIKFPATQVPSADPNTLDDYEEGTFMPVITGTTTDANILYNDLQGTYQKTGNTVHFSIYVTGTVAVAGSGQLRIKLPLILLGSNEIWSAVATHNFNIGQSFAIGMSGTDRISIQKSLNNGSMWSPVLISELPVGSLFAIAFSGHYKV